MLNCKMLMDIGELLKDKDIKVEERHLVSGDGAVPHWHDYFEFEIVISGKAEHIYNGEKHIIQRGSAYLLSYCDFHSLKALDNLDVINVRFNENLINSDLIRHITLKPNKLIYNFNENETCGILKSINDIKNEISNPDIFGNIVLSGILSNLIISLLRLTSDENCQSVPMLIQRAVAYINTNFRDEISLSQLAERLSVSVNYLGTLFKKNLGMTFNDYINNVRLKYACRLLISSDLSVKETAYASGYNSTEYFAYVFKKKINVSPGNYRMLVKT